jgi:hypothetical protein
VSLVVCETVLGAHDGFQAVGAVEHKISGRSPAKRRANSVFGFEIVCRLQRRSEIRIETVELIDIRFRKAQ